MTETYAYNAERDELTVSEELKFIRLAEGGTPLAPLPPPLALASEEGLPIHFSGRVLSTTHLTAHGPFASVDGARSYTWKVKGLARYALASRHLLGDGDAPKEVVEELESQVKKILDAGELAPWYPVLDDGAGYMGYYDRGYRGHFVFGNPAETLYYLAEAYPCLNPATQKRLLKYLEELRNKYPPEELHFKLLSEGAPRERYRPTPSYIVARLNQNFRQANFYIQNKIVPVKNLYCLARYCELTGKKEELKEKWEDIFGILSPYLINLDWGTMGFYRRPANWHARAGLGGVIDINDFFGGLVGAIRLARMAGDQETEEMLWGLFGRSVVLRFALAKYYRYLYKNELLRLPEQKDWMMKLLAGSWHGYLYSCNWTEPGHDVQQVWQMDQFGTRYTATKGWAGIMTFLEPVPELGLFFKDYLQTEARALMRRVNEAMPAWWTVYCPCVQTVETNFQPPEDSHQLFMLTAWVLGERPDRLAWLRDVPWLARGDLFYIHKLAETIRAYKLSTEKKK